MVLAVVGDQLLPVEGSPKIYKNFLLPNPVLSQGVDLGHTNVSPDGDGVVRALPLFVSDASGSIYPSLSTVVLCDHFAQPTPQENMIENDKLCIVHREIPVDSSGNMKINFSGGPGAYQRLSYSSVVEGDFDPAIVKHKMVLIGMTATAEPDFWITPISPQQMSGVEIHANAIDTILRQRFLREENRRDTLLFCLLLVVLALIGCDKTTDPASPAGSDLNAEPDLNSLMATAWPEVYYPAPGPLVTATVGEETVEFWPYTASDLVETVRHALESVRSAD